MRIGIISAMEYGGGAEAIARHLHKSYVTYGHNSTLWVGRKDSTDRTVQKIRNRYSEDSLYASCRLKLKNYFPRKTVGAFARGFWNLADNILAPQKAIDHRLGHEHFDFGMKKDLLERILPHSDIIHCHNLHAAHLPGGGYFDLSLLPIMSRKRPTLITLHDAWLLSGHCAHSFDCFRWETGCSKCPNLSIEPALIRDGSSFNWKRKQKLFRRSRLHIVTPSNWLMSKVEKSMLQQGILHHEIIPNGIDLDIFHPRDRIKSRAILDIPQNKFIMLFCANHARKNPWRDYHLAVKALKELGEQKGLDIWLVVVGDSGETITFQKSTVFHAGYESDPDRMALYYSAADIYIHASKADNFPNTILEAMACAIPVIASDIGGIPEQVQDGVTGYLVEPGKVSELAGRIENLFHNEPLCRQMSENALHRARSLFDVNRMAESYLNLYSKMISKAHLTEIPIEETVRK